MNTVKFKESVKQFIRKNYIEILMFVVIINVMAIGVSLAYFTSKPTTKINSFNAGNVTIDIVEDKFDTEKASNIDPGESVAKNPSVENVGKNSAYVFLKITVPRQYVKLVDEKHPEIVSGLKLIDLFTYKVNEGWDLIDTSTTDDESTYIYAYTYDVVRPGETSRPVFDEVTMPYILEGQLDSNKTYTIGVDGLAIQNLGLEMQGSTIVEKLTYAYNTYLKG